MLMEKHSIDSQPVTMTMHLSYHFAHKKQGIIPTTHTFKPCKFTDKSETTTCHTKGQHNIVKKATVVLYVSLIYQTYLTHTVQHFIYRNGTIQPMLMKMHTVIQD